VVVASWPLSMLGLLGDQSNTSLVTLSWGDSDCLFIVLEIIPAANASPNIHVSAYLGIDESGLL
jgi:hypothetical protein